MSRRQQLHAIFESSVAAVAPGVCLRHSLERCGDHLRVGDEIWDLRAVRRLVLLGAGKASLGMGAAAMGQVADVVDAGLMVSSVAGSVDGLEVIVGGHPVPSAGSVRAGAALFSCLAGLEDNDRFLFLLSGGASALCELPVAPLALEDLQTTTRALLASGATIGEVNRVRKHLSQVKGGRLARAGRGRGAVLVLSDVIGDDLSVVGSGPFFPDPTTYADCLELVGRLKLASALPASVMAVLLAGAEQEGKESSHESASRVSHFIVGSSQGALTAGAEQAARLGFVPVLHPVPVQGEAREVARTLLDQALAARSGPGPVCHLFGGETTVTVRGTGKGGRNQELALAALLELRGRTDVSLLAAGTDGVDGSSDAAGAFVDALTWQEATEQGLAPERMLENNDSHTFFAAAGAQLHTGPTGTNVMDLVLIVRE